MRVKPQRFGYITCKIKNLSGRKKGRKKEMTEVFLNVDDLNDEEIAITLTDEDGIFIDELNDDLLSTSLQELEKKVSDLGYNLTYEDKEDINYYIDNFKDYLYQKNNPYACSGCGYMDEEDIRRLGRVEQRTFRGFLRKKL